MLKLKKMRIVILFVGLVLLNCDNDPNNQNNTDSPSNPNDPNNNPSNPNNTVANWLTKNYKAYSVYDGIVVGTASTTMDFNWIRYNNDTDYDCEMEQNSISDTVQVTEYESYTIIYTTNAIYNNFNRYGQNGNVRYDYLKTIQDTTTTTDTIYVSDLIQDTSTTRRVVTENEEDRTRTYDSTNGLTSNYYIDASYKSTQNDNDPTYSTGNVEYSYTIDLLEDFNGEKTFKSYLNCYIINGNVQNLNIQGFTIYKIRNSITLEETSYNADGNIISRTVNSNISNGIALLTTTYNSEDNITSVVERTFPTNNTICTRLPYYTLDTTTTYSTGNVTTQTVEVL